MVEGCTEMESIINLVAEMIGKTESETWALIRDGLVRVSSYPTVDGDGRRNISVDIGKGQ